MRLPRIRFVTIAQHLLAATLVAAGIAAAQANTLSIEVKDGGGAPLADAVAYAVPAAGHAAAPPGTSAVIDQIDREFVPLVSVIQTGTAVRLPNRDNIRHHVYSFSPPKVFELKLYSGVPARPIVFDKPGLVVLGCNIHDSMIAYVMVVDTPWFARTGPDGLARIDGLPAGEYQLHLWHPRQSADVPSQPLRMNGSVQLSSRIELRRND